MADAIADDATAAVSNSKLANGSPGSKAACTVDDRVNGAGVSNPASSEAPDGSTAISSKAPPATPATTRQPWSKSPQYSSATSSSSRDTGSRGADANGHSPGATSTAASRGTPGGTSPDVTSRLYDSGRFGGGSRADGDAGDCVGSGGGLGGATPSRSTPSGANMTAATPGQPRPQAMSPGQGESPHAEGSLPAVIRDALRRRSNRRTFFEHSVHKEFSNGDKYRGEQPHARSTCKALH